MKNKQLQKTRYTLNKEAILKILVFAASFCFFRYVVFANWETVKAYLF